MSDALQRGRGSFQQGHWGDAYDQLSALDRTAPLGAPDLEHLATAAFLTGRDTESPDYLARAHRAFLDQEDAAGAGRCAFWLAFGLFTRGDMAQAGGWLARAQRLLDEGGHDCVERGYLLLPAGMQHLTQRADAAGYAVFTEAAGIGERFRDRDLVTMARHGQGRAKIRQGNTSEGMALLDEVMIAVTGGEVSSKVAGIVYCGVISACHETFDLRRAQEWTDAFTQWCTAQVDLVPYRGHCLVRRAEILQLHGAWGEAMDEARRAGERLSQPPNQPELGAALYQQAEIHRLRGEFAQAEEMYRQASQLGRQPQPGLAQLRLAQGQTSAAAAAIGRALEETTDRRNRPHLLLPHVEIMLAANEVVAARAAATELAEIATEVGTPWLRAMSAHAAGAVLQFAGEDRAALAMLRDAGIAWQELQAPYETARVRLLMGLACRALGDTDSADLELEAARQAFRQLGATPDLARADKLAPARSGGRSDRLTARELQVLRLIAKGKSNRAIATGLGISEKTVARHVSNIFTKLDLSSRSAATAYAFQSGLV